MGESGDVPNINNTFLSYEFSLPHERRNGPLQLKRFFPKWGGWVNAIYHTINNIPYHRPWVIMPQPKMPPKGQCGWRQSYTL